MRLHLFGKARKVHCQEAIVERFRFRDAPGDAALGQDGGFVGVDGAQRDRQCLGNLIGAQPPGKHAQHLALPWAEPLPYLAAARIFNGGQAMQLLLDRGGGGLGQDTQARKVGAPGDHGRLDQLDAVGGVDVHLRAVFDPLQGRLRCVHVPDAVLMVTEQRRGGHRKQCHHASSAAQTEVQPPAFVFQADDQVANGLKGGLGVSHGANVVEFPAVGADRRPAQAAAPPSVVIVNEFLLQPLPGLPGARVGEGEVKQIDIVDLFSTGQQGVEGKGDDLWLAAESGDQNCRR